MTTLRIGVGIATLIGCALYGAVSVAFGQGAVRDDVEREWRVAVGFAILMTALAPVIANSVSPVHARSKRIGTAGFWTMLFPLITMFSVAFVSTKLPMAFALDGGFEYLIHYATYCSWTSGAIGGVGFASIYAHRTRFSLPASQWRTRILVALGAAMSALTMVFMVPFIILVLGIISVGLVEPAASEYVLPASFSGKARIWYNDSSAQPLKRNDKGILVYYFPISGQLWRGDPNEGSRRMPKVFLADSTGARTPLPRGTDEECAGIFTNTPPPSLKRDVVCAHRTSSDGPHYVVDFFVRRRTAQAVPSR